MSNYCSKNSWHKKFTKFMKNSLLFGQKNEDYQNIKGNKRFNQNQKPNAFQFGPICITKFEFKIIIFSNPIICLGL